MFKEMCSLVLTAGIALPALFAAAPESAEFLKPERWRANAAGKMSVVADPANDAVRFEVDNSGVKDFWFYPIFRLKGDESLDGARKMHFEYKLIAEEPGTKLTLVMLDPESGSFKPNGYRSYPAATGEWQSAEVSLSGVGIAPADTGKIRGIRIGANPKAAKVSYLVRNVKFSDAAASAGQFSAALNKAERWQKNSSGDMTIAQQDDAIVFDADCSKAKDFWLYPIFTFQPGEVLEGTDVVEFEIKADGDPTAIRGALVMFCPARGDFEPKAWSSIAKPNGEWQKVSVPVAKVQDPTAVQVMRVGVNTKAPKQNLQIRNVKVKQASGELK